MQNQIDLSLESEDWGYSNLNPMVRAFGRGPKNTKCKHCKHLYQKRFANSYYKCELRINTNGSATDHRVNWDACSKYEKDT